jgi:ABC-type multidrug transport system fused ATPase/permease subunit
VVAVGTSDIDNMGSGIEVIGRGIAALVAVATVAAIMLNVSVPLGLVVVLGVPAVMVALTPLLRRLHHRQSAHRELVGELTGRANDMVSGLRVLRGIGGEAAFAQRYRAESTLGRLLAGIEPPSTGEIAVDGVPLVELPLDELRGHVALVTQEHHVFAGTIRQNVVLAHPDAADDEVWAALSAVDADGWVAALPDGLETRVGAGALALSPAQAQQLALARLVLADPHTLVLDEATSLLDPRAARHLERSRAAVLRGRTVVAIAHRLHTAHDADRVAVVSDGRITELGSHAALVAAGGEYAALWDSWHGTPTRADLALVHDTMSGFTTNV